MYFHSLYCNNDCLSLTVSDSGLSSAAVAGIVVALLAAAALITGLVHRHRMRYTVEEHHSMKVFHTADEQ